MVDVLFKYRDKYGKHQPDEITKVCLCLGHHKILKKIHKNAELLEMRGETSEDAMHEDLFQHFKNKNRIFTLIRAELLDRLIQEEQFYLFRGRDVEAMRKIIYNWHLNKKYVNSYEEGFFQTVVQCIGKTICNEENYQEVVIEHKKIVGEIPLARLANGISEIFHIEDDGTISKEPLRDSMKAFFLGRHIEEEYKDFEECIEFIDGEIDKNIIDWKKLRENSAHTEHGLFHNVQQFTQALIADDTVIPSKMFAAGDLTAEIVWITYIMANHRLLSSRDPKKDLTKNSKLIEWFILLGLQKELLALAISGERERYLMVKRRAHYNILHENEFVVEYLVPKHISGETLIYTCDNHDNCDTCDKKKELTSLEFWQDYNNSVFQHCDGNFNEEPFEKNEKIRMHLEKHTLGKLDTNLLTPEALEMYNTIVIEKGQSAAEFIILGCHSFFEPKYITNTLEEVEKILPGIMEMYEQKKRDLRNNTYDAWAFVNNKLREICTK